MEKVMPKIPQVKTGDAFCSSFISVICKQGRFTRSENSIKTTGKLPEPLVDLWFNVMWKTKETPAALAKIGAVETDKLMERANKFAAYIPSQWPDWDKAFPTYAVGQKVRINLGKRRGIIEFSVEGDKPNYVLVTHEGHKIDMHKGMIVEEAPHE
jgi:hypothetical protein